MKHVYLLAVTMLILLAGCSSDSDVDSPKSKFTIDNSNFTSGTDTGYDQDQDSVTDITDSYRYQIPVIFHVLYKNSKIVSTSRLTFILNNVNDLWKGKYGEGAVDPGVDFVMATHNPKGRKLTNAGVEYIKYTGDSISVKDFMKADHTDLLWDPNNYVNVFIFPFKNDDQDENITLGISNLPYTTAGHNLAGLEKSESESLTTANINFTYCVALNSDYLPESNDSWRYAEYQGIRPEYRKLNSNTADISVSLAHELGHYLGLHHVFSEDEDGNMADNCYDTDYCEDTKSYNRSEYNEYEKYYIDSINNAQIITGQEKGLSITDFYNLMKRTTCSGESFFSHNLLDYSVSNCDELTSDQRDRIRHVLYYSPMIPGPKKNGSNKIIHTRAAAERGIINLPVKLAK